MMMKAWDLSKSLSEEARRFIACVGSSLGGLD